MLQAVLFDLDGLLFDTEQAGADLLRGIAERRFPDRTEEIMASYIKVLGSTFDKSVLLMKDRLGQDFPAAELLGEMVEARHRMSHEGSIPPKKGMEECLLALHREGLKIAVVTGSPADIARRSVENIPGLAGIVDAYQSCEEVPHSKPAPDGYLEAARKLGVPPKNCMGVEDSLNGVRSLRAAGMRVVNIPDLIPFDSRFQPFTDHVLPDLTAVPPLVRRLNRGGRLRG